MKQLPSNSGAVPAFEPRLSQLGPAIAWLHDKGVSTGRLAVLFETTPANIRVLKHRAKGSAVGSFSKNNLNQLLKRPLSQIEVEALGFRSRENFVELSGSQMRTLDGLEEEMEREWTRHTREYRFLEGVQYLRQLRSKLGYPANLRSIRFLGKISQRIAWFLVHSGMTTSSLRESIRALQAFSWAYHQFGERLDLKEFYETSRYASHACLLSRNPTAAWNFLDLAQLSAEAAGITLGSDFYRQQGVICFQLGQDDLARKHFTKAMEAMVTCGEANSAVQIQMVGAGHTNLLNAVNCESALELADLAGKTFGSQSLEYSITVHWAAACAFVTDCSQVQQDALTLLQENRPTAARFGHQATLTRLLSLTPELGLYPKLRSQWVRRVLYQNAFRDN